MKRKSTEGRNESHKHPWIQISRDYDYIQIKIKLRKIFKLQTGDNENKTADTGQTFFICAKNKLIYKQQISCIGEFCV